MALQWQARNHTGGAGHLRGGDPAARLLPAHQVRREGVEGRWMRGTNKSIKTGTVEPNMVIHSFQWSYTGQQYFWLLVEFSIVQRLEARNSGVTSHHVCATDGVHRDAQ